MGKLIVIEGVDGSGKETQTQLLYDKIMKNDELIQKISFPRYDDKSSLLVKKYLNGEFGNHADDVSPKVASSFFAVDRYISYINLWGNFYENDNSIILADRYVTANMVHQAAKLSSNHEKSVFIDWLKNLEYSEYKLPEPDMVFFLKLPVEKVFEIIEKRQNKISGDDKKDIHEKDNAYLQRAYDTACYVAQREGWIVIDCMNGEIRKTKEEISEEIFTVAAEKLGILKN